MYKTYLLLKINEIKLDNKISYMLIYENVKKPKKKVFIKKCE